MQYLPVIWEEIHLTGKHAVRYGKNWQAIPFINFYIANYKMADLLMNKYREDLRKTNYRIIAFTILLVLAIITLLIIILR